MELDELQVLELDLQCDETELCEARNEFKKDLNALTILQEKFEGIADFQLFADFLLS